MCRLFQTSYHLRPCSVHGPGDVDAVKASEMVYVFSWQKYLFEIFLPRCRGRRVRAAARAPVGDAGDAVAACSGFT